MKVFKNLFRKKPKFIYEISGGESFLETTLYNSYDLVQTIIDEDFRFKRDYLKESVVITKVKNDIQGTVYFEKRIWLPQDEGFDWMAELSDFFTKKPLAYSMEEIVEEKRLEEDAVPNVSVDNPKEAFTLEDFELSLQQKIETETVQTSETPTQETESISVMTEEGGTEEPLVQISKNEFLSLKKAIEDQNRKIAKLREAKAQEEKEEKVQSDGIEPVSLSADPSLESLMPKRANEGLNLLDKELEIDVRHLEIGATSDEIVQNVLQTTKIEIDQALAKFVETEMSKIKEEIKQLDKRGLIEEMVTKRLETEEQERLANLDQQLAKEKEQQVQEEKTRHQQALQKIDHLFLSQLQEETTVLQEAYKDKINQTIKEEYEKQTEQLSRILQGKMDELKIRQYTMNVGLEANFKEALVNFNRDHTQVIQAVEQKKQASPIDFEKIRMQKQA